MLAVMDASSQASRLSNLTWPIRAILGPARVTTTAMATATTAVAVAVAMAVSINRMATRVQQLSALSLHSKQAAGRKWMHPHL